MKKNSLTLLTGVILGIIFLLLLFTFQVRLTEVAVVTTFGKYSRSINAPGFYFRLPFPVNKVYKFDNRLYSFERKFEQTTTQDGRSLLVTVYAGWRIENPKTFLERFNQGDVRRAEELLANLVRDAKNGVIGRHSFSDLISTNPEEVRFDQIESEMLSTIQTSAAENYGIHVELLGIKQLGLPESITEKVFERMREERQRLVKKFTGEGEAKAIEIRADADRRRQELLAEAEAQATIIRGKGDAEAAKSYAAFEENPDLAIFLFQLKALEESLKNRSTLILNEQTPPFNILNGKGLGNLTGEASDALSGSTQAP